MAIQSRAATPGLLRLTKSAVADFASARNDGNRDVLHPRVHPAGIEDRLRIEGGLDAFRQRHRRSRERFEYIDSGARFHRCPHQRRMTAEGCRRGADDLCAGVAGIVRREPDQPAAPVVKIARPERARDLRDAEKPD